MLNNVVLFGRFFLAVRQFSAMSRPAIRRMVGPRNGLDKWDAGGGGGEISQTEKGQRAAAVATRQLVQ